MTRGLIIAAPGSGSGKTTITLGLLRALTRRREVVRGAKSGPDYIDPRFHAAACGQDCVNLDAWAMGIERLIALAQGDGTLIIEGAMGLFDGAPPHGKGATSDLARHLGLPVVLVIDASHMAQSVAALADGFARFDWGTRVAGVILNKLGSDRHERMVRKAMGRTDLPILGAIHRNSDLTHPARHLGLVQASERADLDAFLDQAADTVARSCDLEEILKLASDLPAPGEAPRLKPPAQRIAIAQDVAFAFAYPHILNDWSDAGAEIETFSPLADEAPPPADLIFLPGGYPELHAGHLAGCNTFLDGLRNASETSDIYGECGGYMMLGQGLTDADGTRHAMAGLLPHETSFATRKLHLGYRNLIADQGPFAGSWLGHEFHYSTQTSSAGTPLFSATDAEGAELPPMGLIEGRVSGSYAHIIDAV